MGGWNAHDGIVVDGLDGEWFFQARHLLTAARRCAGRREMIAASGCNARDGVVIAGLDGGGFFKPHHMAAVGRVCGLGDAVGVGWVGRLGFGLGWSEGQSGLGLWLWALIGGLWVVGARDPIALWLVLCGALAMCRCGQHCWAPPWEREAGQGGMGVGVVDFVAVLGCAGVMVWVGWSAWVGSASSVEEGGQVWPADMAAVWAPGG